MICLNVLLSYIYIGHASDIAVLPGEDKVYFTTVEPRTVEVISADGSGRTELFKDPSNNLVAITIDTKQR